MNDTHHVLKLLHTIPDFIISALLRGNLTSQMAQDVNVRSYVVRHMALTKDPSIYMNLLHDQDGLFLSSNEVELLLAKMDRYLKVDPMPRQDQIKIDNQLSNWNDDFKLRFRENDRSAKITRQWMDHTRKTIARIL